MRRNELKVCFKIRDVLANIGLLGSKISLKGVQKNLLSAFILLLTLNSFSAYAQETTVTGSVKDGITGESLLGVSIVVKGTTKGTVSDLDGNFTMTVDANDTLQFSYIGYLQENFAVGGQTEFAIELAPDIEALEEVVVVGYGTMKKSDVTGSIVSIKEEEFSQVKSTNVIESLQGKAAGVDITRSSGEAGSGISVTIRGNRTLSGSNTPLYIVDGIQYSSGVEINPSDIASIEILKDVSSTSIYGAKGANGVIIISTKKGTEGKPKITFSTYVGQNKPLGSLPYMDRADYIDWKTDITRFNSSEWKDDGIWLDADSVNLDFGGLQYNYDSTDTDNRWIDELYRTGYLKNYFLSVSGGKSGIAYNVSIDHTNEQGMLQGDDYKRYTIKGGFDVKVTDFLNVGTSNIVSYIDRSRMSYPEKNVRLMNPMAQPFDSAGELNLDPNRSGSILTPLWYYQDDNYYRQEVTTRSFSNIYANVKIMEGLSFKSTLNASFSTFREGEQAWANPENVNVHVYNKLSRNITWQNILSYNKSFGIHKIQFTGVHELLGGQTERYRIAGRDPQITNSLWYAIDSWDSESINVKLTGDEDDGFNYTKGTQLAYMARVNYSLLGKYIFAASMRYDGASQLATGHKWESFPSASVAWNAAEESFIKGINAISSLKLRFGYGVSGNFSVPKYVSIEKVNTSPLYYEFGESESVSYGYRPTTAKNAQLSWEKTSAFNFGIDFGLLRNRLSGNFEHYQSNTTALLQQRGLPPSAAIPSIYDNVGETQNKGFEVMLHSINVSSSKEDGFNWTTDISFSRNQEKIVSLSSGKTRDVANGWFVGQPADVYYYYEKIGVWQLEDSVEMGYYNDKIEGDAAKIQAGEIKVRDANNDTIIDDKDRTFVGTPRPDWYGSISNRFEYKGFDFSFIIMARIGQTIKDRVATQWLVRDAYNENGMEVDYWTPDNPTNAYPRLDQQYSSIGYVPYANALEYTDGSWVKIRDITLGYTLPKELTESLRISNLRVYLSMKNAVVLWSPYFDNGNRYDPEQGGRTSWPAPKSFIAGLTLDF